MHRCPAGVISLRPHRHRYQSTVMGSFQTLELIETFISYAESIKRCVCIVYDPQRASAGGHALKAVRLKESFIQARPQPAQLSAGTAAAGAGADWPRPAETLGQASPLGALAGRLHAGRACSESAPQVRA